MTAIRAVLAALGLAAAVLSSTAASADFLDRAISLAGEERYLESRRLLDPLLERDPGNPHGRLLHGILRVHEGKRDEAMGIFRQLVREFPDLFEAYNNLAVLYLDQGRLEDARGLLLAILDRQPEAIGYRNLADIYLQLAERAHARSLELSSDNAANREGRVETGSLSALPQEPSVSAATAPTYSTAEDITSDAAGVALADTSTAAPAADPPEAPENRSDIASAADIYCVSLGEFGDRSIAEDVQEWLRSRGAEMIRLSHETREVIENYRVYLPPLESRERAAEKMRELQRRGVRDIAVILKGPRKHAVSLGIYASQRNVERRVANLAGLGYSVVSEPNNTAVVEYLSVKARVRGAPDALATAWRSRFPGHAVRHVDCV